MIVLRSAGETTSIQLRLMCCLGAVRVELVLLVATLVTLSLEFVGIFGARSVMETSLGAKSKVSLAGEMLEALELLFVALMARAVVSAVEFVSTRRISATPTATPVVNNKKKFRRSLFGPLFGQVNEPAAAQQIYGVWDEYSVP